MNIIKLSSLPLVTLVVLTSLLQGCAGALVAGGAAGAVSLATDRRTTGTIVEDQAIEFRVANGIHKEKELKEKTHINTTSFNNVVLLTGEAPTEALRQRAEQIARNTEKVKRVHNEITIAEPRPLQARNHDAWITTKAKAKLFAQEGIGGTQAKVITNNGTIYLMGLVTREEAGAAVQAVSQVNGVKRIVKIFEYVQPET